MLDLVARHGHLDLEVAVSGDLETGAHHTVEDTGIVLGQAIDRALADRRGITRYGQAIVPMDEARATCAIDISAARSWPSRPSSRPQHRRIRPRAGRGVLPRGRDQRQAHAAHRDRLGNQRPPHDRGGLQGIRPCPAHGGRDRSDRERRAIDQGDAHVSAPAIAVVDYGMGNRRSVEKALDHVGARATITRDHDEIRAGADGVVARCRSVPTGDGQPARARARRRDPRRRPRPRAGARICLGMQLLFDSSVELGGATGLGLLPGEVRRLEPGRGASSRTSGGTS